uniref:Uncharacterized protein n=1 Tax=Arundo donax TaxID=35708 RepID=A0A0A9AGB6_ARUDO
MGIGDPYGGMFSLAPVKIAEAAVCF